ncbi:hypothetical protein WJX81_003006 [Elliptochloris bilobata]|uniref:Secreted protein n=1 Tax=Elliptochloris bilobata TaxID=381761 RepID=A0AAW1S1Z6_9CHLO
MERHTVASSSLQSMRLPSMREGLLALTLLAVCPPASPAVTFVGAAPADSGSRKVRAGGDATVVAAATPAAQAADPAFTGDEMAAPVTPVAAQAAPAAGTGAAHAGVYTPGNRQAAVRLMADPVSQASPACGASHVQAFTVYLGGSGEARPQGSVRFFLVGPITDDLGTVQVVAPSDPSKSDNFARIVVDLRLKQAGTYSVKAQYQSTNKIARGGAHAVYPRSGVLGGSVSPYMRRHSGYLWLVPGAMQYDK